MEEEQKLEELIERLHARYKHDADLERMPSMTMLLGNRAKQKLDDLYGITYMKKRLEIEEKLKLNESIQKDKEEEK